MRILLFGYFTREMGGEGTGGVATYVRDIAVGLRDMGYSVAVWGENARFWRREWNGITLYGAPSKLLIPLEWIRNPTLRVNREWFWGSRKRRIIEDFRPDIFHSHSPHHLITPTVREVPLVSTFHSMHFYKFAPNERVKQKIYNIYKSSLKTSRYVLFSSRKLKNEVFSLLGDNFQKPHKVIPPVVDTSRFFPYPKDEARKVLKLPLNETLVGFAGLLTGRKGEDILINASKGKDWILVFAGSGPNVEATKALCERIGCKAIFLGDLDTERMLYFYNAVDVFVLPSRSETFGIVVIEAMACGRTVVVSEEVPEEAAPKDITYRVNLTPDDVRAGIEKALSSPIPPDKLISHTKRFSDLKKFAEEHIKVYSEVLQAAQQRD